MSIIHESLKLWPWLRLLGFEVKMTFCNSNDPRVLFISEYETHRSSVPLFEKVLATTSSRSSILGHVAFTRLSAKLPHRYKLFCVEVTPQTRN